MSVAAGFYCLTHAVLASFPAASLIHTLLQGVVMVIITDRVIVGMNILCVIGP